MKKLKSCNNVVITSLIVIGTFIVFFYLYVYGYKNEGFINFDGNQTIWDKKNDLENKLNDIKVSNQAPLNPPPKNTNCGNLTEYGEEECNKHIDKQGIRCKWNSHLTSYYGGTVTNSQGGQCTTT
jgi:hypothetical protein